MIVSSSTCYCIYTTLCAIPDIVHLSKHPSILVNQGFHTDICFGGETIATNICI